MAGLNEALKETLQKLETLSINPSVYLSAYSPGSPQWSMIKLSEDKRRGFLILVALEMYNVQLLRDYSSWGQWLTKLPLPLSSSFFFLARSLSFSFSHTYQVVKIPLTSHGHNQLQGKPVLWFTESVQNLSAPTQASAGESTSWPPGECFCMRECAAGVYYLLI